MCKLPSLSYYYHSQGTTAQNPSMPRICCSCFDCVCTKPLSHIPRASKSWSTQKSRGFETRPGRSKKYGFFQILENHENDVISHDNGFLSQVHSLSPITPGAATLPLHIFSPHSFNLFSNPGKHWVTKFNHAGLKIKVLNQFL